MCKPDSRQFVSLVISDQSVLLSLNCSVHRVELGSFVCACDACLLTLALSCKNSTSIIALVGSRMRAPVF